MPNPSADNPFAVLGLTPDYRIDRDAIERAYRIRLANAHPDAGGSEIDPSTLNQARATLLDDELRAITMLQIMGGPDASSCKDLPEGFLMHMMMQRQEIEEAIESGGEAEREEWEQWGEQQRWEHRERVASMFEKLDPQPDPGSLRAIRVQLNAWRYIERLIEQLDPEYDPARADFRD